MVEILFGRAGTGKTHTLMQKAKDCLKGGTRVCFVVPEQLTMTREMDINSMGLKGIEVLSFTRLADTVFRTLGGGAKKHPDKTMVASAVFSAVDRCYNELTYFKRSAYTHGFISALISAFSEFDTNRMSEQAILSIPDSEWSERAKNKYRDMFKIYNEYKSFWSDEYKDPAGDSAYAASLLETNDIFTDTVFLFDGFFGFTPAQLVIIEQIILQSPLCVFAFTTDMQSDIFCCVTREVKRLCKLCLKHKIKTNHLSVGDTPYRLKAPALIEIEKNAFLPVVKEADKCYDGALVYMASNINDELGFIACKIKNDVLDGKYGYGDIAILCPDAQNIAKLSAAVFEKHGIPVFIDTGKTLLSHPIVSFVLSALEIARYGFEYENVFSFLKTGLTGIPFDDISLIENYVRIWKIRSSGWKDENWTKNPNGLNNLSGEIDKDRLEKINDIKDRAYLPLSRFCSAVSGKRTCKQMLLAVIALIDDFKVFDNLLAIADSFKQTGDMHLYNEYTRVYGVFVDMLDSIYEICAGDTIDCKRFYDLLCVCASQTSVQGRPARAQEVLFAPMGMARAEGKKCVYVPCLNSNVLPSSQSSSSLITETDKRVFERFNIDSSMNFEAKSEREHFDFYCALTTPSDELVLSYSAFRVSGEALSRSQYLDDARAVCGAKTITRDSLDSEFFIVSIAGATDEGCRTKNDDILSAVQQISGISKSLQTPRDTRLSDSVVEGLYSRSLRLSFSGMEEYVSCPFKFFIDRGLRAGKNEPVEFSPANIGTFIHSGLEKLLGGDFDISTPQSVSNSVKEISRNYKENELCDLSGRSKRFDYMYTTACYVFESAAQNVVREIRNSDFKPFDFEVDISKYAPPFDLGKGYTLTLVGSIDRVDKTDDGFAKIIDYKSGSQNFSLKKIYNGLSMQLPVYASAIRAKNPDINISAMYYLKVGFPKVDIYSTTGITDAQIEEKIQKYYVRDGVFCSDTDTLSRLDGSGEFFDKIKKDRLYSTGQINSLIDFTVDKIKQTGEGITSGCVDISPICDGSTDACMYCDYKSICQVTETPEKIRKLIPVPENFLKD